jgi:hypothetical protein
MTATASADTRSNPLRHWAEHSHGFRVLRDGKKVGFVQDVIHGHGDVEGALVVRGGRLGRSLMLVPLDDVVDCDPHAWRIAVREVAHEPDPAALDEWRRRRREVLREDTSGWAH